MKNNGSKGADYSNILKTTFLFGFVQIFNIIVKVILNKTVAIILGAEGMGIIGIYNAVISMIKTGAGLGISQSAVRDISEANASNDYFKFSHIISVTKKVVLFTGTLGLIITIVLSPYLSYWYFNTSTHQIAFVCISVIVAINIISEGQLAILKGMRQLKNLAKASLFGAIVGLVVALPCYYFFDMDGIIPSILATSIASLLFSSFYVSKIKYQKVRCSLKELFRSSTPMIKMGIALMMVSFISALFDMIIAAYISNYGGLSDVGFYNAGSAIVTGYFGIIITSMSTDYYPRISAINKDNNKLQRELNKQSETSLIIIFPLVLLFVFLSPLFIKILYSDEFYVVNSYTDYAMIGTVIIIVSNCMGMILLAKQASNIFIFTVLLQRFILIGAYIFAYNNWGLLGLGFSYIFTGVLHLITMSIILYKVYNIRLENKIIQLMAIIIISTLITIFINASNNQLLCYIGGSLIFLLSCTYTIFYMKNKMNINMLNILRRWRKK